MIILCAFINGMLRPETEEALARYPETRFVQLDKDYPRAYGKLLTQYWEAGETFLNVEQDMRPSEENIQHMRDCTEQYCAGVYEWSTDVGPALGFTCFRSEFLHRYPNAMADANARSTWKQLDVTLQRSILVRLYGEQPHVHEKVVHLNPARELVEGASEVPLAVLPAW